jgi:hypothetical protein
VVSARGRVGSRSALAIALMAWAAGGCEVAETIAPEVEPRAVVHAVLNPTSAQQLVIVERTLRSAAGAQQVRDAITDARVVIHGPHGDSAVAVHDASNAGVYRLQSITVTDGSPGGAPSTTLRLRPGEQYRLRIETSLGVVLGETTIPVAGPIDGARRTFNVDRDTLRLVGAAARGASGYVLRHETFTGGRERFVTSLDDPLVFPLKQAGAAADEQEWAFAFVRAWVRPGHAQGFAIVAVDSNYFRYYVAGFDPFGDDTRGNTLSGGVGLFGSVAPLMSKTLDLVADIDTPIEGTWTADRSSPTLPAILTLYSSPYFPGVMPAGQPFVSGRGRTVLGRLVEVSGSMNGPGIGLEVVEPGGGSDPFGVTGELGAGTLVLTDVRTRERMTYRKR